MKQVKIKQETSTTVMLGDEPISEYLRKILELCHDSLEYSTAKVEECETLYEDNKYEELYDVMSYRISALEGAICNILDLLED